MNGVASAITPTQCRQAFPSPSPSGTPAASAEWRNAVLAQTESLTGSGGAEIDPETGLARLTSGLKHLLQLDVAAGDVLHMRHLLRRIPREEHRHVWQIWRSAVEDDAFEFRHRIVHPGGRRSECLQRGLWQRDAGGVLRAYLTVQDITPRHQTELRLQELTTTELVTGLTNRRHLLELIEAAVDTVAWDERGVAVLSIKVEQIDYLQQAMGFAAADELARCVAERLRSAAPSMVDGMAVQVACLARVGSSEFAQLLRAPVPMLERAAHWVAQRQVLALAEPEQIQGVEMVPGGSVGIALLAEHSATDGALLQAAQMAGKEARQSADHIAVFTARTREVANRRLALEAGLRHAVERAEMRLMYRPQAHLEDGRICGAEALLRWHSPSLGDVEPSEFIPVAEQTGLIVGLGEWVMHEVCRAQRARRQANLKPLRVFVNLSPLELQSADLSTRLQSMLVDHGVDAAQLGFEITDRALVGNADDLTQKLQALRALGVAIALDNFGLGEATLSLLRRLPLQYVKVPLAFVPDVTDPPESTLLLRAMVQLAHSMRAEVIALGADTTSRMSLLLANGCDRVQGEAVAPCMTSAELVAFDTERFGLPSHLIRQRMHPRTLLLVDDDPGIVSALRRLFRSEGYRLLTASSGAEGLQRMAESPVDVVLSDQRMPGMTGVEFLRRVKSLYPQTVRIVLSGYTELQSITDAVNEGSIYRFLTKPWDDEQLRQHVREAFAHKGMSDENERLGTQLQGANRELERVNQQLARVLEQQTQQTGFEAMRASSTRHMLDRLPVPTLGVDEEGLVVMANTDAYTLLGHRVPLLGEPLGAVLGVPDTLDPRDQIVELAGRRFRVRERDLQHPQLRGHLVALLEQEHTP